MPTITKAINIKCLCIFSFLLLFNFTSTTNAGTLRDHLNDLREHRQQSGDKQALAAGDYTFNLTHDGVKRMYMLHVPKSYHPEQATPLVLSLHGGGGNMEYQATDEFYHLISKSESAGFIAAFPNGYSSFRKGKLATWNAGICCGKARDTNSDDVGFIRETINDIKKRVNIDNHRIYADGMSNGGMMSYRLACEMTDTFAAIASVAGTDGTTQCNPSRPIPTLHIHALDDDRVLFNGGSGSASATHADFVSVPNTIAKWVGLNSCNTQPKRVLAVEGAYCDLYDQCKEEVEVKLCVTETGGHSWPGGKKIMGKKDGSTAINANDVIWAFFQAHPKP
jgi:polyhydroxybutyrate depolymerase